MIETISNLLINGGVKLLGNTVKGTTELGLRKLGDFVKEKTGVDLFDNSVINSGLNSEQIVALKKMESDYNVRILEIGMEYAKMTMSDTASARDLQKVTITSEQASWLAKNFIYILTFILVGFTMLLYTVIAIRGVPVDSQRMVDGIITYLNSATMTIIGFFFGNNFGGTVNDKPKLYQPTPIPDTSSNILNIAKK